MVIAKIKSRFWSFLSLKISEELSAKQMYESQQIQSLQIRQVEARKQVVRQRFYPKMQNCLFFTIGAITTEPMGIWRPDSYRGCRSIRCRGTTR